MKTRISNKRRDLQGQRQMSRSQGHAFEWKPGYRMIAETDARSVGDIHPSCFSLLYRYATTNTISKGAWSGSRDLYFLNFGTPSVTFEQVKIDTSFFLC